MSGAAVEGVDPADRQRYDEWFAVVEASGRERWPGRPGWQPDELRAPALAADAPHRTLLLGARDGGMVGAAMVELPRHDNLHLAQVTVEVHPAHRRRGVGSALLAAGEALAVSEGRGVVYGWEEQPLADGEVPGPGGTGPGGEVAWAAAPAAAAPGRGFPAAHGYSPVLAQVRRDLALPPDPDRVAGLTDGATIHAAGYEAVAFPAPWPEEWLAHRALFGRHMSTDAPVGEWAMEEEAWDPDRVRRFERLVARTGRELLVAVAVERRSGQPVAFSELSVSRAVPEIAYQWDTLVLPGHRGHRLGLLVKLANLRQLAERSPGTSLVATWNARANGPMIAVNEALGCQVVAVGHAWQRRVGTLV